MRSSVLFCATYLVLGLLAGNFAASARDRAPLSGTLVISGASTMMGLVGAMAERFEKQNPGVHIELRPGPADRGVAEIRQGKATIAMVARTLNPDEQGLTGFPVARDGIGIVVHRQNPLQGLSAAQLREVMTGKVTNWRALGGPDAPIYLVARRPGGGASERLAQYLRISVDDFKSHLVAGVNAEVIDAVSAQTGAVSYMSLGDAERSARAGVPIKLLALAGVEATSRAVLRSDFPVTRPLMLVTAGKPGPLERAFIDFALTPQVVDLIRNHGFVPYQD
jgi:phosphate transport system substrate-binding protein